MSVKDPNLPGKILAVDNDQSVLNAIKNICNKYQVNALTAQTWQNAVYLFNQNMFDLAVVQINLEEMSGLSLLQKWRGHEVLNKRTCSFILTLGGAQAPTENNLVQEIGDTYFLLKPIKEPQLISMLGKVMVAKKQREQIATVRAKLLDPLLKAKNIEGVREIATTKLPTMGLRGAELAGDVLEEVELWKDALNAFEKLHDEVPLNMRYVNEIGKLNLKLGNLTEAKAAFERADKVAPNNVKRIRQMASMYMQLKDIDKSIDKCKQAIAMDPSDENLRYDIFAELQSCGYEAHAAELCAATTDPMELIRYFNNKGVMHSKNECYNDAINEYRQAQKLIPGNKQLFRILYNEALANINQKTPENYERAMVLIKDCLKLNSNFDKAQEKLIMLEGILKKTG